MKTVNVTVNLPVSEIKFLQEAAEKSNVTFTEVLQRAINTEKFFVEQERKGNRILVQYRNRIREVIRK